MKILCNVSCVGTLNVICKGESSRAGVDQQGRHSRVFQWGEGEDCAKSIAFREYCEVLH